MIQSADLTHLEMRTSSTDPGKFAAFPEWRLPMCSSPAPAKMPPEHETLPVPFSAPFRYPFELADDAVESSVYTWWFHSPSTGWSSTPAETMEPPSCE